MISVIIPTYNRASLIERAIRSVSQQTYSEIEIIVVDDASTDNTSEIVSKLDFKGLKYIVLEKNAGACHARNVGIENSHGEYIAFLDSDDTWEPTKLEQQMSFMQAHNAMVVFCNYWLEKGNQKNIKIDVNHSNQFKLEELLNANVITTGALLVDKRALEDVGRFDEAMPRYQDWELVLRLAKKYDMYYQNTPLLTLYFQENSITNSTSKEKKFKALQRMVEKNRAEMEKCPKALAHHCWSMGLYSMYMDEKRWDLLKDGVYKDGFNPRRFAIYLLLKLGFVEAFKKQYSKNH